MKISVAGTGYVGLVAGVAFSEIGHQVTCVDVDEKKIKRMQNLECPIYEKDLLNLMLKNKDRLTFTIDFKEAYKNADIIFIGVGTPEQADGSANLSYVYNVCNQIVESIEKDTIVVIKSTVPVGTNDKISKYFKENLSENIKVAVISNPEFLAQGTAVHDTLYAPRVVIGIEDNWAESIIDKLYLPLTKEPYNQTILKMNRCSAEMTKYASNDFLALKISYINEIANLCEKTGANVEQVTKGMSYDPRIGKNFLKAGIGFGGSCFPKDTKALYWLSKKVGAETRLIREAIEVNKEQKIKLFTKAHELLHGDFVGKKVAILGATFKPDTDDLREGPSIDNIRLLLGYGAIVSTYDPVGLNNLKNIFGDRIEYNLEIDTTIKDADICLIMTEWEQIKKYSKINYKLLMKESIVFDGRNCYDVEEMKNLGIQYYPIGRGDFVAR
ncbi:MAG: UDP-glucose/GDP-mannose dehydrogenase family protein [Erysipelotrichaceae bacterium]